MEPTAHVAQSATSTVAAVRQGIRSSCEVAAFAPVGFGNPTEVVTEDKGAFDLVSTKVIFVSAVEERSFYADVS